MRTSALAVLTLLLAGCAVLRAGEGSRLTIAGSVTQFECAALPADSVAVVELRERGVVEAPVLAEVRVPLRAGQVPVPFELQVDRASLKSGRRHAVRAAIVAPGVGSWAGEPVDVDPRGTRVELGTLQVARVPASGFVSVLRGRPLPECTP